MAKLDLKKQFKDLYQPSTQTPSIVTVPPLRFLMIDGTGDPNTAPAYTAALEALYGVAYALKFAVKAQSPDQDYTVPPLEGLWWVPDMRQFSMQDKTGWLWTMMIMQPEVVTAELVETTIEAVRHKKNPASLSGIRFEEFTEGQAAQIMHIGPYAAEAPTITRLHTFIAEKGYQLRGKHHEIYLSDPGRTAPDKLKTIIRQPVAPA
ncbi:MAG: GyrI-like domain-containing protein [Anaerolineae bacterium]|nr:GyrI-like domain-containing protein [Anaerolineae bacterium]